MVDENAPRSFVAADAIGRHGLRFASEVDSFRVRDDGGAGAPLNEAPQGQPGYLVIDDTFPDMKSVAPRRRLRRARERPARVIVGPPTVGSMAAPVGICILEKPPIGDTPVEHGRTPSRPCGWLRGDLLKSDTRDGRGRSCRAFPRHENASSGV